MLALNPNDFAPQSATRLKHYIDDPDVLRKSNAFIESLAKASSALLQLYGDQAPYGVVIGRKTRRARMGIWFNGDTTRR